MDFWMIARNDLENDLLGIFRALDDLQYKFDWVLTDHDVWFGRKCPEEVRERWEWSGLLLSGKELTEHCSSGYVTFVFNGVLSAVPLGTKPEQVCIYEPYWEIDFDDTDYQFQTPFTEMEIICYDGGVWVIICKPEYSNTIRTHLPKACSPQEYFA